MTKRVLMQTRDLETAAEKAGGYVIPPSELPANPKKEREFFIMRQYSIKNGIPMSRFTKEDYRKMGIKP